MSTFPWLTVVGAIPLAGSLAVALIPGPSAPGSPAGVHAQDLIMKWVALGFTAATLAVTAAMAAFRPGGPDFQLTQVYRWIPQFGVYYAVGTDEIALVLIVMTAVLTPLTILASWHAADGDAGPGEASRHSVRAVKFLLYNLLGGLLVLAAVIALVVYSARGGHPGTFLFSQLVHLHLGATVQKWLFAGFFIAFAIKASAVPGDAVMIGVMDKVGTFAMSRYFLDLFPTAAHRFTPLIVVVSVIGVLYAAIVAIGQADLRRLIAYLSVSGMALITLGIFAMTSQGQAGAALQMVNHGFLVGALFLITGFLIERRRSPLIAGYGGAQKAAPVLAGLFLVACLAGLALPGLNTFVSEFLVLICTFTRYPVAAGFATTGIILSSIYMLWTYQRTMTGPVRPAVSGMPDLRNPAARKRACSCPRWKPGITCRGTPRKLPGNCKLAE